MSIHYSFLQNFKRSAINYENVNEDDLLEAYRSGVYDTLKLLLGESCLKITGTSHTTDEVKKFLRQTSFAGELCLSDNKGERIQTVLEQEAVAERWAKENINQSRYTQLILMIPKDNDRDKLKKIVLTFLKSKFSECNYIFTEHTDTDIFHYHVIVEKDLRGDLLLEMQADFIATCLQCEARLF